MKTQLDTKKIGILTFQNTINYGAVLQAHALQKYLTEICDDVVIIDYYNNAVTRRETPTTFKEIQGFKEYVKYFLNHGSATQKYREIKEFCGKNLTYSEIKYYENDHPDFKDFDAIIAGSDQIWNTGLTDHDMNYLLGSYQSGKKYSYAASIGQTGIIDNEFLHHLSQFRRTSVREEQAHKELEQKGIESCISLDPTFLLDSSYWADMCSERVIEKKYVLLYQMTTSDKMFHFAKNLAKETGAVLINANPISLQIFKSKCIRNASPEQWLSLIYNAEYVVTNSFHGLAFSINFGKQFYTEIADNEAKNSSRITSLLDMLDLNNRNISGQAFYDAVIDYRDVYEKLDPIRESSQNYLKEVVEDIKLGE